MSGDGVCDHTQGVGLQVRGLIASSGQRGKVFRRLGGCALPENTQTDPSLQALHAIIAHQSKICYLQLMQLQNSEAGVLTRLMGSIANRSQKSRRKTETEGKAVY